MTGRRYVLVAMTAAVVVSASSAILVLQPALGAVIKSARAQARPADSRLLALLPGIEGWKVEEAPRVFFPENLFEHIDGAAESYLAYDFKELLVADLKRAGSEANLTVEIYDMGDRNNAFGIFAAERYPENEPVDIGVAGYIEGEVLNFAAAGYYVKLLAFDAADGTRDVLTRFAAAIAAAAGGDRALPEPLGKLPEEGRVARSERYIRLNALGFEFLRGAWLAAYRAGGGEYELFFVPFASPAEAKDSLDRLFEFYGRDGTRVERRDGLALIENRPGRFLVLGLSGRTICGATGVADASRAAAESGVRALEAATSGAA